MQALYIILGDKCQLVTSACVAVKKRWKIPPMFLLPHFLSYIAISKIMPVV
jgi:hypothetical protein